MTQRVLLPLLAALVLSGPSAVRAGGMRAVEKGIAIELSAVPDLKEGQETVIRFRLSDQATGTPLAGASPAAWLDSATAAGGAGKAVSCTETVEQMLGGSFFRRPAVDLNAYKVLALNDDATVSVIDPLSGFGGSKLLAQVKLESPGDDWVLSQDRARLYVSQPAAGKVAAVDTADWRVVSQIDAGPLAGRLALEPDGGRLWVSTAAGVAAVDTASLKVLARFEVGTPTEVGGPRRDLVLSDDGRNLFAVENKANAVAVIDTARLVKVREAVLGGGPTSVAWSPLAHAVYVVAGGDGKIFVVNPDLIRIRETFNVAPGAGPLRFALGGRFGILANAEDRHVHVLDVAAGRFIQSGEVPGVPEQIALSDTLAYVRQRDSDSVLMITLASLGEKDHALSVADFPGGEHPPGPMTRRPGDLSTQPDAIVRAPEPGGVLVANAADGAIYYYREGMAAPMGSFQDYGGHPRAVLVVDRSLKERSPGTYETVARMPGPGAYRFAFFLDSPRTVHCFDVTVAEDPVLAAKRLRERPYDVAPQIESRTLTAGVAAHLRFRITDPATHQPVDGLADVQVMAFLSSGAWQSRLPARSLGGGIYEADFNPPGAGSYHVAVECPSGRVAFNRSPQVVLRAVEGAAKSPDPPPLTP